MEIHDKSLAISIFSGQLNCRIDAWIRNRGGYSLFHMYEKNKLFVLFEYNKIKIFFNRNVEISRLNYRKISSMVDTVLNVPLFFEMISFIACSSK